MVGVACSRCRRSGVVDPLMAGSVSVDLQVRQCGWLLRCPNALIKAGFERVRPGAVVLNPVYELSHLGDVSFQTAVRCGSRGGLLEN